MSSAENALRVVKVKEQQLIVTGESLCTSTGLLLRGLPAQEKYVNDQGPVVQSIVSLTSSLRVISLTVLADSLYNNPIFFAEKM